MQLCAVHAERFGFRARNPGPEWETAAVETEADLEGCVVALLAVEATDASNRESVASAAADTLSAVAEQLNTESVVFVPCPHLSDEPAPATQAAEVVETLAREVSLPVHRVPLGWDIAYDLQTKAHPYSIQAVQIDAPEEFQTEWFVASRSGTVSPVSEGSDSDDLDAILALERAESAPDDDTQAVLSNSDGSAAACPDAISTGATMGLWQPGDRQLSVLPRGVMVLELLGEWFINACVAVGDVPVSAGTPEIADARSVFAALEGTPLDEETLPIRVFDPRAETAGRKSDRTWVQEATGPQRGALVADETAALAETCQQSAFVHGRLREFGLDYQPVVTVTDSFRSRNEEWIAGLGSSFDRDVLVGSSSEQSVEMQIEFVVLDGDGRPLVAPRVTLDPDLPARLGIELAGTAESTPPVAVRSSPLGGFEQFVAAIIDGANPAQPPLPVWLAPTQFRLIPIDGVGHLSYCERVAARFEEAGVRVDIDNRALPVNERQAAADNAGIPYHSVIGDEELEDQPLDVSIFAGSDQRSDTPDTLCERIEAETVGYPSSSWGLPRRLRDLPAGLQTGT